MPPPCHGRGLTLANRFLPLSVRSSHGVGLIRPLEVTARKSGVQILLEHKMTGLVRENPTSGRVIGLYGG